MLYLQPLISPVSFLRMRPVWLYFKKMTWFKENNINHIISRYGEVHNHRTSTQMAEVWETQSAWCILQGDSISSWINFLSKQWPAASHWRHTFNWIFNGEGRASLGHKTHRGHSIRCFWDLNLSHGTSGDLTCRLQMWLLSAALPMVRTQGWVAWDHQFLSSPTTSPNACPISYWAKRAILFPRCQEYVPQQDNGAENDSLRIWEQLITNSERVMTKAECLCVHGDEWRNK